MLKSKKRSTASASPYSTQTRPTLFKRPKYLGFLLAIAVTIVSILVYAKPWSQNIEPRLPFIVVKMPGKGMGAVATRDINQGELLIREKPLLTVPSQINVSPIELFYRVLSSLSAAEKAKFFSLSAVRLPPNLSREEPTYEAQLALAITQTNAIALGDKRIGLFPTVARLNHGCSSAFNSVYSWREDEGVLVVYALKPIKKGEELLTTYTDTKRSRDDRRQYLLENYDFKCNCPVCSLPSTLSRASDKRLMTMTELHQHLSKWSSGSMNGKEAIAAIEDIWAIGDQEGYWSERGSLAADAAWVAATESDSRGVRNWAGKSAQWYSVELGTDSPQVGLMLGYERDPESHPGWAATRAGPR